MATGGAFGGKRGLQPMPPEKGVFPLDHFQECQTEMKAYILCLQQNNSKAEKCRHLSKTYLECRMQRSLMAKQNLSELGFPEEDIISPSSTRNDNANIPEKKEEAGFVSGLPKK